MKTLAIFLLTLSALPALGSSSSPQAEALWTVSGTLYTADGTPAINDANQGAAVFVLTDAQMKLFNKCLDDGIDRFHCADRNQTDSVSTDGHGSFTFRLKDGTYHLLGVVSEADTFEQFVGMETVEVRGADVHKDLGVG